jgi:hypothetical protein
MAWPAGLIAVAVALAAGDGRAAAAPAAEPATRLDYVRGPGAESCPDRAAVMAAVAARLGYSPFSNDGPRVLRCEIARAGAGLRAQIALRDAGGAVSGARTLASERSDCRDLLPAMLLVLSVAARPPGASQEPADLRGDAPDGAKADPGAGATGTATVLPSVVGDSGGGSARAAPRDDQTAAPAQRGQTAAPAQRVPSAAPAQWVPAPLPEAALAAPGGAGPARSRVWRAGAGVIGTAGAAPGLSWGATVFAGVRWGALSVAVEPRIDVPASTDVPAGGRISVLTASGAATPCVHAGGLAGCAVVAAGIVRGRGQDVLNARAASAPWLALGGRAAWELRLGASFVLRLHADVLAIPIQTVVRVGDEAVWRTPRASLALGVAAMRLFP